MRIFYFVLTLILVSCNSSETLKVATSANMQFAMQEIIDSFMESCHCQVDLITGSSGKLTAQIEQGAPYDIFVSANTKYPTYLFKKGLTKSTPKVYAQGQLVLWSSKPQKYQLSDLTSDLIKQIAIPNPKNAPYGQAAIEVLKQKHIYHQVKQKLVYGESVSQVNQFVESQTVDVGFTAFSVVKSKNNDKIDNWSLIDKQFYQPILQSAVMIDRKNHSQTTIDFFEYLFSDESQLILKKYGYLIPNE